MNPYHKIVTVYKRDPNNNNKTLLYGQWATDEFHYLANTTWFGTEKIDGTNIRVIWDGESVSFRGKSDRAQMPPHLLKKLEETFTVDKMLDVFWLTPACLYGEGYGVKIQKGGKYIPDGVDFILFDVYIDGLWLKRKSVTDIADKLEIKQVPEVFMGKLKDAVSMVETGFMSELANCKAEGLVLRPMVELLDRRGNRIITKIKHKDFPQ